MAGGFIPTEGETRVYHEMSALFASISAQPAAVWRDFTEWQAAANSLAERLGAMIAHRLDTGTDGLPGVPCARFVNRDGLLLGSGGREQDEPLARAYTHTLRNLRGFSARSKTPTAQA